MATNKGTHITEIQIANWMGVRVLKLDRPGKMTVLSGRPGAGKSALLLAIEEAFKKRGHSPERIRQGEDKAEIYIKLDDGTSIEKIITPTGNKYKVVQNGEPVSSPVAFLSSLLGESISSFNPVAFTKLEEREQRKALLQAIPFDLDQNMLSSAIGDLAKLVDLSKFDYSAHGLVVLDAVRESVYEQRAEVNRDVTRLKKAIEQDRRDLPDTIDREKYERFDLKEKTDALSAAQVAISNHQKDLQRRESMRKQRADLIAQIDDKKKSIQRKMEEIEQLRDQISEREQALNELVEDGTKLSADIEAFSAPDIESLQQEIGGFEASQRMLMKLEEIDRKETQLDEVQREHANLDNLHKTLTNEVPKQMLAKIAMPIEGLRIEGSQILVTNNNGVTVPLKVLSDGETLDFAIHAGRSMLGGLQAMCVDGIQDMDDEMFNRFVQTTKDDGVQYFVTKTANGALKVETDGALMEVGEPADKG